MTQEDENEHAYAVIEPYFDAVRDTFAAFEPEPGETLALVQKTKLQIDPSVHDSARHYAACRDDGRLVYMAPHAAKELETEELVAMLCHELGHAVDFLYPGRFRCEQRNAPAIWLPFETKRMGRIRKQWHERNHDQVEWDADAIAHLVIGQRVTYCGPCMVQCFSGIARPPGLK